MSALSPRYPAVHLLRALVVLVLLPDGHGGWLWWRAGMGVFERSHIGFKVVRHALDILSCRGHRCSGSKIHRGTTASALAITTLLAALTALATLGAGSHVGRLLDLRGLCNHPVSQLTRSEATAQICGHREEAIKPA